MPVFEWSDEYETGIPDIDKDHKEIFSLINRLHDSPREYFSQSEIDEVIARLLSYVVYHFEREENLLSVIGYGELEPHAVAHKALAKRMNDYAELYQTDPDSFDMDDFVGFLADWLKGHILVSDMAYLSAVRAFLNRV